MSSTIAEKQNDAQRKGSSRFFVIGSILLCIGFVLVIVTGTFFLKSAVDTYFAQITPTYAHIPTTKVTWRQADSLIDHWQDTTKHFYTTILYTNPHGSLTGCDAVGTYVRVSGNDDMVIAVT